MVFAPIFMNSYAKIVNVLALKRILPLNFNVIERARQLDKKPF